MCSAALKCLTTWIQPTFCCLPFHVSIFTRFSLLLLNLLFLLLDPPPWSSSRYTILHTVLFCFNLSELYCLLFFLIYLTLYSLPTQASFFYFLSLILSLVFVSSLFCFVLPRFLWFLFFFFHHVFAIFLSCIHFFRFLRFLSSTNSLPLPRFLLSYIFLFICISWSRIPASHLSSSNSLLFSAHSFSFVLL